MSIDKAQNRIDLVNALLSGEATWLSPKYREQLSEMMKGLSKAELMALFQKSGIAHHPIAIEMARRMMGEPYDMDKAERT